MYAKIENKLQNVYLTYYCLLIAQDLWQFIIKHCQ